MTTSIKPNWCFIRINENKDHWNLPGTLKPYVDHIYGIYAFNRTEHTNCCELEPSYYMQCMGYDWDATEDYFNLNDRKQEHISEQMADLIIDVPLEDSTHYRHVRSVEKMIADGKHKFHEAGEIDPDFEEGDREYEMLADYWNPNPRF